MIIIETCPQCGHDLHDLVLTSYPPKSGKMCMNCGWRYVFDNNDDVIRVQFRPTEKQGDIDVITSGYGSDVSKDPCRHCSNDPRNGGSGICCCTVPYMSRSPYYTSCESYPTTVSTSVSITC